MLYPLEGTEKRVLGVFAHPDDAELLCFGTLLKCVARGFTVGVITATDGGNGTAIGNRSLMRSNLGEVRAHESAAAFNTSGISHGCLGLEDGSLVQNLELVSLIERCIALVKPDVVLTHFIDTSGADHQDHSAIGRAVVNSVPRQTCIKSLLFAEPIIAVPEFRPNVLVNISSEFDRKIEALSRHESQKDKYYLSRGYQVHRARQCALQAGANEFGSGNLFEAFQLSKCVV